MNILGQDIIRALNDDGELFEMWQGKPVDFAVASDMVDSALASIREEAIRLLTSGEYVAYAPAPQAQ